MITAIAIDNEPPALEIIESFCERHTAMRLLNVFTNTKDAVQFLQRNEVQLVFLDIEMPAISGIDFKKQFLQDIPVIFTTAFSEYALEGFEVNAVDYLLKPFSFERFYKAVEKAQLLLHKDSRQQYLTIRVDHSFTKIALTDIKYIEALDDYIKLVTITQKPLLVRMPLKNILEQLPLENFVRIHRSYVVAVNKIKSYSTKYVQIDDLALPVGSSYGKIFWEIMNR